MVSRNCPQCGSTWYSADDSGTWICPECGAQIPPEKIVNSNKNVHPLRREQPFCICEKSIP